MRTSDPSDRDYGIFMAVEFEHVSLRAAAEQWQLSPTRIGQIVAQVRAWYVDSTPQWVREVAGSMQPVVAARRHDQQLQQLTSAAMQAWHASQGEVTTRHQREGLAGGATTRTMVSFGQTRYLVAVARLSEMRVRAAQRLAKITSAVVLPCLASESDNTPPEMPCAREGHSDTIGEPLDEDVVDASDAAEDGCGDMLESLETPPFTRTELQIPVRAKVERKLSRKQRRKLARLKSRAVA